MCVRWLRRCLRCGEADLNTWRLHASSASFAANVSFKMRALLSGRMVKMEGKWSYRVCGAILVVGYVKESSKKVVRCLLLVVGRGGRS